MSRFSSFRPLMHEHEYKFIERYLKREDVLLEYGAGNSTLYFSDFVKKLISLEHDVDYYNQIKKCIDGYGADNVELYHVEPTIKDTKVKRYDQLKDYIEFPVKKEFKFNKILIDGRARKECALFLSDHISNDDVVFIHDFNSNNIEGYIDDNYHNEILAKYDIIEFEQRGQGIVALKKKEHQPKLFETRDELIKFLPKNINICEVGVFKGDFSKFIYAENNPSSLFLIDVFNCTTNSGDKDGQNITLADLRIEYEKIKEYFKDKNVKVLKGRSVDMLANIEDSFFDMIYIDADHSYDSVYNDLALSYHKVKTGGLICGHDYNPNIYPQVFAAVNNFCKNFNLKIDFLTKDKLPSFGIVKNDS